MVNRLRPLELKLDCDEGPYRLGERIALDLELTPNADVEVREGRVDLVCEERYAHTESAINISRGRYSLLAWMSSTSQSPTFTAAWCSSTTRCSTQARPPNTARGWISDLCLRDTWTMPGGWRETPPAPGHLSGEWWHRST